MTALTAFLKADRFRRVPLVRTGVGHFEAAGTLDDAPIRVLIDTGAASTVLSLALGRRLGLELVPLGQTGGGPAGRTWRSTAAPRSFSETTRHRGHL